MTEKWLIKYSLEDLPFIIALLGFAVRRVSPADMIPIRTLLRNTSQSTGTHELRLLRRVFEIIRREIGRF